MKRLRITTETETLHDETVEENEYAERLQAYQVQIELYALQGITAKLIEGDDVENESDDEE